MTTLIAPHAEGPLAEELKLARRPSRRQGLFAPDLLQAALEAVVRHAAARHPVEEPGDVRGRGRHRADASSTRSPTLFGYPSQAVARLPDRPRRLAVPDRAVRQLRLGAGRGARQGPGRRPAQDAAGRRRPFGCATTARSRRPSRRRCRPATVVVVEAGQIIPGDGEIIEGVAVGRRVGHHRRVGPGHPRGRRRPLRRHRRHARPVRPHRRRASPPAPASRSSTA